MVRPDPTPPRAEVTIRPYEPRDRQAVREVCYVTGYMGDPVDWIWRDRESFADLFTSYYTDAEPESAFVAEHEGKVSGYLLGCVDTSKTWDPTRIFLHHFVRRQIGLRRGTAGVVWRSMADIVNDALHKRLPPPRVTDARWPAHLHIDLLPGVRGLGVGSALMRRWLTVLGELEVSGCHLETLGENHSAISFFTSQGFSARGRRAPIPGFRSPSGARHTVQLMVQPFGRV